MSIWGIIVAAGKGKRMGSTIPKQYLRLGGKPILYHTVMNLSALECIDGICLVVSPESKADIEKDYIFQEIPKLRMVIEGGILRQDSVLKGLQALPDDTEIVMIHDGVRPFPPKKACHEALEAARKCGAAILGVPVVGTVKKTNDKNEIVETVKRENLYEAQTPQVFQYREYLELLTRNNERGFEITDDASVFEAAGRPVKVIPGSYENLKITTPVDLIIAERIFHRYGMQS